MQCTAVTICFVEWPEKAPQLFDETAVHVVLEPVSDKERRIKMVHTAAKQQHNRTKLLICTYTLSCSSENLCMSQAKPIVSPGFRYETLEETLDIKPKGARLHIGIPKEVAFQENRIALIPDAVSVLVSNGHQVTIEHNAGEAAHYSDNDYSEAARGLCTSAKKYTKPRSW